MGSCVFSPCPTCPCPIMTFSVPSLLVWNSLTRFSPLTSRENANLNLGFMGMSFRMRISTHKKIFVHDPVENVLTARSKGFTGIVLDDAAKVIRALRNLFGDPVQRGQDFLNRNAKRHVERTLRSF